MNRPTVRAFAALLGIFALLTTLLAAPAQADVSPDAVEYELALGESADPVIKSVTVPTVPTVAEICLVTDVSGSFSDDYANLLAQATAITAVAASADSALFGLASFADYPTSPYGTVVDTPYTLVTPLTDDLAWQFALGAMAITNGADIPESQLDAIYGAVNGLSWGLVDEPSCGFTGVLGSTAVIIATTDAPCHEPGVGKPHQRTTQDVADTLNDNDVVFIGLDASAGDSCFDELAALTGGVTVPLAADGSNITDAIVAGLATVEFDITPEADPVGCADLSVTFEPATHTGVGSGETVEFTETITYTGPGTDPIVCTIEFGPAGVQTITVTPILEVLGDQGCSPGYWGRPHHIEDWGSVNPDASFLDVFGVGPDEALIDVVNTGGGKFTSLNRQAVAAYVNARSEDVLYPIYSTDVVDIVADAYGTGDWQTAKAILEPFNNSDSCPL